MEERCSRSIGVGIGISFSFSISNQYVLVLGSVSAKANIGYIENI